LRRALDGIKKDSAIKHEELALKRETKRAEVETARIELASLELEQQQAVIRAPIDGIITRGDVKVGDLLEAGKSAVELARQEGFVFEAAVPSEDVGHLRTGMRALVKLDAFDYQRYGTAAGAVCFLSPDSGVSEGQKTAIYTVRIALESDAIGRGSLRGQLKLGMAGHAEIITDRESLLALLAKRIRRTISLG
jgi:HlyD family secretion protein